MTAVSGSEPRGAAYLSRVSGGQRAALSRRVSRCKGRATVWVIGGEKARAAMESAADSLLDAVGHPEQYLSELAEGQFQSLRQSYRALETFRTLTGQSCPDEVNTFRRRGLMGCASLREALRQKGRAEA